MLINLKGVIRDTDLETGEDTIFLRLQLPSGEFIQALITEASYEILRAAFRNATATEETPPLYPEGTEFGGDYQPGQDDGVSHEVPEEMPEIGESQEMEEPMEAPAPVEVAPLETARTWNGAAIKPEADPIKAMKAYQAAQSKQRTLINKHASLRSPIEKDSVGNPIVAPPPPPLVDPSTLED